MSESNTQEQYRNVRPLVDIYESNDNYSIVVDVPGVPSDSVDVQLEGEHLSVSGTRKDDLAEPVVFRRSFTLPATIDREGVVARVEAGVLTLTLPKQHAARPRQIAVKAA